MLSKLAKAELRKEFLEKRKNIPSSRREQASSLALTILKQWIEDFSKDKKIKVFSFASFGDEIDIWAFNRWLMKERTLVLARVEKNELNLYEVSSLQDLEVSSWGILEPKLDPKKLIDPKKVDVAVVAGLAFDNQMHRLGYGKGFYDKLLCLLSPSCPRIGVGFKEQLLSDPIPSAAQDISVTHRFLF